MGKRSSPWNFLDGATLSTTRGPPVELDTLLAVGIEIADAWMQPTRKESSTRHQAGQYFRDQAGARQILDFAWPSSLLTSSHFRSSPRHKHHRSESRHSPVRARRSARLPICPRASPRQELDPRTDLFSFGTVLYEMATAGSPFAEKPPRNVRFHSSQRPVAPVRLNPDLPSDWKKSSTRRWRKTQLRYQHAADMRADCSVSSATPIPAHRSAEYANGSCRVIRVASTPAASRTSISQPALLLRQRRRKSESLCARVEILAPRRCLLVALVAGAFYWRSTKVHALTEKDTILLADFVNTTAIRFSMEPSSKHWPYNYNNRRFFTSLRKNAFERRCSSWTIAR